MRHTDFFATELTYVMRLLQDTINIECSPNARSLHADSEVEELLELRSSLLRVFHTMADSPRVFIDLVVIASLERLVSKKVNRRVLDPARQVLLVLHVPKAICLVPAFRKHIE